MAKLYEKIKCGDFREEIYLVNFDDKLIRKVEHDSISIGSTYVVD